MPEWLENIAGPDYAAAVLWTLLALVAFAIVLVIIRLIRGLSFGTFVAGGRNRKTRLAVMDATAVDSHRRLVLVRRDDVEHLILIGGPTDVVVEQGIRLGQARRPALTATGVPQQQGSAQAQPGAQQAPRPAPTPKAVAPAAPLPVAPLREVRSAAPGYVPPRLTTAHSAGERVIPLPSNRSSFMQGARTHGNDDIDQALVDELSASLDAPSKGAKAAISLDDEMNRLLGEISGHKR